MALVTISIGKTHGAWHKRNYILFATVDGSVSIIKIVMKMATSKVSDSDKSFDYMNIFNF